MHHMQKLIPGLYLSKKKKERQREPKLLNDNIDTIFITLGQAKVVNKTPKISSIKKNIYKYEHIKIRNFWLSKHSFK